MSGDRQTVRVDTMLTGALDSVEKAGEYVTGAVNKSIRQANGILASIRAVVETLRGPAPGSAASAAPPRNNDHSL